jgi:transposase
LLAVSRAAAKIILTKAEARKLELIASRPKSSQRDSLRARIVLAGAENKQNKEVAEELGVCVQTVGKWRKRFAADRLDGLVDAPRSGAPRTIGDAKVEVVLTRTLEGPPGNRTHWSRRRMAKETGIGQDSVGRIWRTFGVKPHVVNGFKLSKDPRFTEKTRDIVGLYLNPPD